MGDTVENEEGAAGGPQQVARDWPRRRNAEPLSRLWFAEDSRLLHWTRSRHLSHGRSRGGRGGGAGGGGQGPEGGCGRRRPPARRSGRRGWASRWESGRAGPRGDFAWSAEPGRDDAACPSPALQLLLPTRDRGRPARAAGAELAPRLPSRAVPFSSTVPALRPPPLPHHAPIAVEPRSARPSALLFACSLAETSRTRPEGGRRPLVG